MKNKFGTHQLPTAELELRGAVAELISPPGRGIPVISALLNVTRLHNTAAATGLAGRALATARQWALNREVFGVKLSTKPLHLETLATLTAEYAACVHLLMDAARLLGLEETDQATDSDKHLLRLLTPLIKLYTGKASVAICSESLECLGGVGYLEGSGLPRALRDAQVLPVWEGTTNVLALDMLRAVQHTKGASINALVTAARTNLSGGSDGDVPGDVTDYTTRIVGVLEGCQKELLSGSKNDSLARDIALQLSRSYAASLLCVQARWSKLDKDWAVFKRFCGDGQVLWSDPRWLSAPSQFNARGANLDQMEIFPITTTASRL